MVKASVGVQDPVDGGPAVLVQRYNITQQKQLELQLSLQQEALQRSAYHTPCQQLRCSYILGRLHRKHANCSLAYVQKGCYSQRHCQHINWSKRNC